jgi:hypothetical protein
MPRPAARDLVAPYAVAWAYLAGVTVCGVAYLLLPRAGQAAVLRFASTNVHNLHTDPVGYRVSHGALPPADRYITDVGPSYVVVAAIAVAILYGGRLARAAALLDLAILIFAGDIFSGLGQLQVAAVGHTTAIAAGAIAGRLAVWHRRAYQRRAGKTQIEQQHAGLPPAWPPAAGPAAPGPGSSQAGATAGRRAADQADQPRPPA